MNELNEYHNLMQLRKYVESYHITLTISDVHIESMKLGELHKTLLLEELQCAARPGYSGSSELMQPDRAIMLAAIDKALVERANKIRPVLDHIAATQLEEM